MTQEAASHWHGHRQWLFTSAMAKGTPARKAVGSVSTSRGAKTMGIAARYSLRFARHAQAFATPDGPLEVQKPQLPQTGRQLGS